MTTQDLQALPPALQRYFQSKQIHQKEELQTFSNEKRHSLFVLLMILDQTTKGDYMFTMIPKDEVILHLHEIYELLQCLYQDKPHFTENNLPIV